MAEGVVVHAEDGRILQANPSAERILGLTLAQMTGQYPIDPRWGLICADGRPAGPADIPSEITRLEGRPCRHHRLGVRRASGEVAWLSVNTEFVTDASDLISGRLVVATFTDISDIVAARAELETERAHLHRVINLVPGVVYQLHQTGDGVRAMTFISDRVESLLGVPRATIGANAAELVAGVHPEDLPRVREAFAKAVEERLPFVAEARYKRGDEWLWVRTQAIADPVDDGARWTGIILDVTADRDLGERLRRSARREAMGEMAAGLAHNLNNLLAAILPNIELAMSDEAIQSHTVHALDDALQATRSAGDLMRQVLAFTRNDPKDGLSEPVELTALVGETLRFCKRTFDTRIAIHEDITAPALHVIGQRSNLQQVFMNLCLNARDALQGREHPKIRVELAAADDHAVLRVTDNGIGMSPDTARRLGEPFFTTKSPGQGTGLGLATVYGIVREAGGTVRCSTTPGVGTAFEVRLPTTSARPAKQNKPPNEALNLSGRVLIIDDEPLVRSALRRQLKSAGLETMEAADGVAGISLAASTTRPDVILLDLSMPGMPGEDVLVALLELRPRIPVIVVSGHRGPSLILDGAYTVLRKPVDGSTLIEAIARALGR
jgi:PAS domain S-box-containing protein